MVSALNPTLFREEGAFETDVAALCNALRTTPPVDPAFSVMVAGDKERMSAERRMTDGIPVEPGLLAKIKQSVEESGVPVLLTEVG